MRLVLACVALAALSCGGGSSGTSTGSATFVGTIQGASFTPRDAISSNVSTPAGQSGVVVVGSVPNLCSLLTAGKGPKSSQVLVLTALKEQPDHRSTAAPSSPGTYRFSDPDAAAFAVFVAFDDNCQDRGLSSDGFGTSGSVTFTSVGDHYAGSFDFIFNATDHATGTFDAPACPALAKLVQDRSSLACQ